MACLNINNLVKHFDEFRVFLAEFSFNILAINKTKLDESIKSSELQYQAMNLSVVAEIDMVEG